MAKLTFNGVSLGASENPCLTKHFDHAGKKQALNIPIMLLLRKLSEGSTEESLTRNSSVITPKDIRAARTYATLNLADSDEYRRNNRYKRTRILLDENLSVYLIPGLSKQLSNLSHIYFEGMAGYTDEFIYWRPRAKLKIRTPRELREHNKAKNIIISKDSDLSDIAKGQWMNRMSCASDPENVDFSDVNVVFHVRDVDMGKPENADWYLPYAKDILRAAHSQEASSYIITKGGVYPEAGCSKQEIIAQMEARVRHERIKNHAMNQGDIAYIESQRAERNKWLYSRTPELAAA